MLKAAPHSDRFEPAKERKRPHFVLLHINSRQIKRNTIKGYKNTLQAGIHPYKQKLKKMSF